MSKDSLNILHISDNSLPDWRIEKAALSAKKRDTDNKVFFAGTPLPKNTYNFTFDWIYNLDWDYKARYYYPDEWNSVKKQLLNIIRDCKPDIIHAHDIFAAQLSRELNKSIGLPFIYDNHEYWSRVIIYQFLQNDTFKQRDPLHYNIPNTCWRKWELDMINENEIPMIVTSKTIAEELNYFNKNANVFVLPNYPNMTDIEGIPEPIEHKNIESVFVCRNRPVTGKLLPIQNVNGFFELFANDYSGLGKLNTIGWDEPSRDWIHHHGPKPHNKMYSILSKFDIGIIPWRHHPFHPYCSPNRAYEFAHTGLMLIIPAFLESVINSMDGLAIPFKNYDNLVEIIKYYRESPSQVFDIRKSIYNHARNNLIWENYEGNIFDAYNKASY